MHSQILNGVCREKKREQHLRAEALRPRIQSPIGYIFTILDRFLFLLLLQIHQVPKLAGNAMRDNKKSHILLAVRNDDDLGKLLAGVTIPHSGRSHKPETQEPKTPKSPAKKAA
ncbi:hypothetical protein AMTRI_Chr07g29020 [Amborella trichopoda]